MSYVNLSNYRILINSLGIIVRYHIDCDLRNFLGFVIFITINSKFIGNLLFNTLITYLLFIFIYCFHMSSIVKL